MIQALGNLHETGRLAFRRLRYIRQQWIVREFSKLYYGYPLRDDCPKGRRGAMVSRNGSVCRARSVRSISGFTRN